MEAVTTVERLDELFASLPLQGGDNIWLVGGHEGLQVKFFLDTYPGVTFDVYEPQEEYVKILTEKYNDGSVKVHPYALGDKTGHFIVGLESIDCTFHWQGLVDDGLIQQPQRQLPMESIAEELRRKWFYPDLLIMNCEGSEYDIINKLDKLNSLDGCKKILVQFHPRVLGVDKCQEAYDILCGTHDIVWRYNEWAWVYAEVKK